MPNARWRHDLKNQLGIVLGYSELILEEMDQSNPLRENVEEIGALIDAIVEGDGKKAAKAALLHVQRGAEATLKLLSSQDQAEKV